MNRILQDKVAIVTGAGRGLGRAHALELAQHGARVVVNDLGGEEPGSPARAVASEIVRLGGEVQCAHVTMTQGVHIGDSPRAAEQVLRRLGEIRSRTGEVVPGSGWEQYQWELAKAGALSESPVAA